MTLALLLCGAALAAAPAGGDDLRAAAERGAAELARNLAASPERGAVKVVAMPPFQEAGAASGQGRLAAEAVAGRLGTAAGVTVLDAGKLEALLGENRLMMLAGAGGSTDPEVLKRAGAQALLTGRVEESGGRLLLTLRLTAPGGRLIGSSRQEAELPPRPAAARPVAVESAAIDVAMRKLADSLASGFARLPGSAKYRRLAVLPFQELSEPVQKRRLGSIVAAEIATDLRRDHGLLLVERARINEVLGELRLQQVLAVEPSQASQIGKLADAQALVLGTVAEAGDRYLVHARIVATQTGETLTADSASVQAAGMVALASDAVVLRSRSGAVFRSLLVPGWGQFYNRQPVKGGIVIGAEVGLFGAALAYHLAYAKAYDDYRSARHASDLGQAPAEAAQALYDKASSRYRVRNGLLLAGGAVWLLNVADAWLSGVDGEAMLGGGVAATAPRWHPTLALGSGSAVAGVAARF